MHPCERVPKRPPASAKVPGTIVNDRITWLLLAGWDCRRRRGNRPRSLQSNRIYEPIWFAIDIRIEIVGTPGYPQGILRLPPADILTICPGTHVRAILCFSVVSGSTNKSK